MRKLISLNLFIYLKNLNLMFTFIVTFILFSALAKCNHFLHHSLSAASSYQLYLVEMCIQLNEPTLKKDVLEEDTIFLYIHSFIYSFI